MMNFRFLFCCSLALTIASQTLAQDNQKLSSTETSPVADEEENSYQNMLRKKFMEIDANNDGSLSQEEYKAYNDEIERQRREIMDKAFLDMDKDNDGIVSQNEFLERINQKRLEMRHLIQKSAPASFSSDTETSTKNSSDIQVLKQNTTPQENSSPFANIDEEKAD